MNHTYRLVWNAVKQLWQCASENTRAKGKSSTVKTVVNNQITPPPQAFLTHDLLFSSSLKFPLTLFTTAILFTFTNSAWAAECPQPDGSQNPFIITANCEGEPGEPGKPGDVDGKPALKPAIQDTNTNLELIIKANVTGGKGGDGITDSDGNGGAGGFGGDAIILKSGNIIVENASIIKGGDGGNGSKGTNGSKNGNSIHGNHGGMGGDGRSAIMIDVGIVNIANSKIFGGNGGTGGEGGRGIFSGIGNRGGDGGKGGNGGNGAVAINFQKGVLNVIDSEILGGVGGQGGDANYGNDAAYGGHGGTGGIGGHGGGAINLIEGSLNIFNSKIIGQKGGDGGENLNGYGIYGKYDGHGGDGGNAIQSNLINKIKLTNKTIIQGGNGGDGDWNGGNGGQGGNAIQANFIDVMTVTGEVSILGGDGGNGGRDGIMDTDHGGNGGIGLKLQAANNILISGVGKIIGGNGGTGGTGGNGGNGGQAIQINTIDKFVITDNMIINGGNGNSSGSWVNTSGNGGTAIKFGDVNSVVIGGSVRINGGNRGTNSYDQDYGYSGYGLEADSIISLITTDNVSIRGGKGTAAIQAQTVNNIEITGSSIIYGGDEDGNYNTLMFSRGGGNAIQSQAVNNIFISNSSRIYGGMGGYGKNSERPGPAIAMDGDHGGTGGNGINVERVNNIIINSEVTIYGGVGGQGGQGSSNEFSSGVSGNGGNGGNALEFISVNNLILNGTTKVYGGVGGTGGIGSPGVSGIYQDKFNNIEATVGGIGSVGGKGGNGGNAIRLKTANVIMLDNMSMVFGGIGGTGGQGGIGGQGGFGEYSEGTGAKGGDGGAGGNGGSGGNALYVNNNNTIILAGKSSLIYGVGGLGGSGGLGGPGGYDCYGCNPKPNGEASLIKGLIGNNGAAIAFVGKNNVFEIHRNIIAKDFSEKVKRNIDFIQTLPLNKWLNPLELNELENKIKTILITDKQSIEQLPLSDYLEYKNPSWCMGPDCNKLGKITQIGFDKIKEILLEPSLLIEAQEAGIIGNVVMKAEDSSVSFDKLKAFAKTNTLALGGDASLTGLSFDLGLIGEVVPADTLAAVDAKPLRAFGLMEKRGTSTWQVTGTLDPNIIERFSVKEGVLELMPDVKVNSHMGVMNSGILTTPAITVANVSHTPIVSQLTVADQGVFQVVANNVNEYSRLHSTGDITLAKGSQLLVHAPNYQGKIGDMLKYVLVAEGTLNTQFSQFSDDNPLYDFVPNYSEANVMHLNVVRDKQQEPLLSGTTN
ncbi:ESPR-type extended signal peptide-containing protein, partial [Gallibacterium salpingitidis]